MGSAGEGGPHQSDGRDAEEQQGSGQLEENATGPGREGGAWGALPEVLVPLNTEEELSYAQEAVRYMYTGRLSAGLGFEALLRVRQQACYLGVKYCPQACDQAMLALLTAEQQQQQQQQHETGQSLGFPAVGSCVVQAYACHALFPEPGTSPDAASFQPVRSALAKQLVSHFGDAVAALTRPDLYRQLLQLPAVAVRELLAADDFGTDSEDSVFLLLACWHEANTDEEYELPFETCMLCDQCMLRDQLRLHLLSPAYLHFVLPAFRPLGLDPVELGFLLRYAGARGRIREQLLEMEDGRRESAWYCSPPRRQVVPRQGRTVEWSISTEQLEQGLKRVLRGDEDTWVCASFGTDAAAVEDEGYGSAPGTRVLSGGFLWTISVDPNPPEERPVGQPQGRASVAGVYVERSVPWALGQVAALGAAHVGLKVFKWEEGNRTEGWNRMVATTESRGEVPTECVGWTNALRLRPAVREGGAAGGGGDGGGGGGSDGGGSDGGAEGDGELGGGSNDRGASLLAAAKLEAKVAGELMRWSDWVHEGKITGSITFY